MFKSNIFKFYINNNNTFNEVYLFIKKKYNVSNTGAHSIPTIDELNSNYNNYNSFIYSEVYEKYFANDLNYNDLDYLKTYNSKIIFVDDTIDIDDTIETIKLKFIKHYNSSAYEDKKICFEELYLYCLTLSKFNKMELFNNLTANNKNDLTQENLISYLININEKKAILESLENKEVYTFDDIDSIRIHDIKEYIPVGQNNLKTATTFSVNPYNYSSKTPKSLGDIISTNNSNMVFDYNIYNNSIIVCLASTLLETALPSSDDEAIIKLYFQFLYSKNIINKRDFLAQKIELLKKSTELINTSYFNNKNQFKFLLAKIYNNSNDLKYENSGIKSINININSAINYNISLETLFKLFTSSELYPFIKYNPGKKMENLYRLYCLKEANIKKVPLLSKTLILKYAKFLGKSHTVSFYVNSKDELFINNVNEFLIELEDSGIINIKIDFKNVIDLTTINSLIATNANNIIKFIGKLVSNNTIELFDNLLSKNVEINSINYITNVKIKGMLKISNITNCSSYLFNTISSKSDEIVMRYKNVSNFSIMNSEESYIIELIKQKSNETDILHKLKENFNLSLEDAKSRLIDVINSLKLMQDTFNHKKITIKNNPGFPTLFKKISSNYLSINIDNIDNINYLDTIPMYIDGFIKILYGLIDDEQLKLEVSNICKKTQYIDESKENTFTNLETTINKNINHVLEDDDDVINDETNSAHNDLMDILLGDGDDDDDDEDDEDNEDDDDDGENTTNIDKKINTIHEEGINEGNEEGEDDGEGENDGINEDDDKGEEEDSYIKDIVNEYVDNEEDVLESTIKEKPNFEYKEKPKVNITTKVEAHNATNATNANKEDEFKEVSEKSNPILKRLINKEPKLFTTDKNKFYTEYSRLCPANVKKQPVILTKEEKDYIDKNHRNSYTESYEYGTKEGNKYYYICPRYWDLEKNISLTHTEVKSGRFGKVITKKNKDGAYDGNIMEFTDPKYHIDEKGNYINHVPGFLDEKHNRNGFCLPCCFNNKLWNKSQQMQRRSKCLNLDYSTNENKKDYYNYIKGPEKMPLEKSKIGFLPLSIQKTLHFDNLDCVTKQIPNLLRSNRNCLLRYGVENSNKHSFIACIADLYETLVLNNTKSVSISEMKKIIIASITIDSFIKYNNGNLPHIFISKNFNELVDTISSSQYTSSVLYSQLVSKTTNKLDDQAHIIFIKKIINSFENFKAYLDSDAFIDYTYLWDIICKSNPLLFPNGLNLIILDITNEDTTNNVKIVCPKQSYSSEFIDLQKKCLLLIQKNEYFEPIYLINNTIDYYIVKTFSFAKSNEDKQLTNFKNILNIIRNSINSKCVGVTTTTTNKYDNSTYDFKPNIQLDNVISILINLKYDITYQIMDYNNKVIGLLINNASEHAYIPCYPSALSSTHETIPYKMIDEVSEQDLNDYNNTKIILEKLYNLSNAKLIIKPLYKIVDDNLIVGILTLGNQFIQLTKPEFNNSDELKEINDKSYVYIDKDIQTNLSIDNERVSMVNNIKLETQFYDSFKNSFKKILGMHKNNIYKTSLLKIINNNSMLYLDKLSNIYNLLKDVGENYIIFSKYEKHILDAIKNVSSCIDEEDCNTSYCMKTNDVCSLIIPNKNLINNENNEEIYYSRLSDEFVRYNKFKNFIFEKSVSYNYGSVKYNILENELLLYHSILTQDYFKDIVTINNQNVLQNTFDTLGIVDTKDILNFKRNNLKKDTIIIGATKDKLQNIQDYYTKNKLVNGPGPGSGLLGSVTGVLPKKSELQVPLSNVYDDVENDVENDVYNDDNDDLQHINFIEKNSDPNYKCGFYKSILRESMRLNFKEQLYELTFHMDNKICSFQLILSIIKQYTQNNSLTINGLKKKLVHLYTSDVNFEILCYILLKNNKKTLLEKVINREITFEYLVYSDLYYITYIDIYMLAKEYNLPIILLCNSSIDLTITDENYIICNINTLNQEYYFFKVPSKYSRKKEHNYNLLYNKQSIKFNIENDLLDTPNFKLYSNIKKDLKVFENKIEKYITNFNLSKLTNTKYKIRQVKNIEIKKK
jgi:hypothetical protein